MVINHRRRNRLAGRAHSRPGPTGRHHWKYYCRIYRSMARIAPTRKLGPRHRRILHPPSTPRRHSHHTPRNLPTQKPQPHNINITKRDCKPCSLFFRTLFSCRHFTALLCWGTGPHRFTALLCRGPVPHRFTALLRRGPDPFAVDSLLWVEFLVLDVFGHV